MTTPAAAPIAGVRTAWRDFVTTSSFCVFSLALWNGCDPILKERAFGLTNGEGNHGEDVKEYYFYLDATPTYSYCEYLYKYPQHAFPYDDLVRTNRARSRQEFEYELIDSGIFNEDRYFDVFAEYGKASAEDILILLTVHNRGSATKPLHLLPTLWFRNLWTARPGAIKPEMTGNRDTITANHPQLGVWQLKCDGSPRLLFTENEMNDRRISGTANRTTFVKDGIKDFLLHSRTAAVNPAETGTKAAAYYLLDIPAAGCATVRLRLRRGGAERPCFRGFLRRDLRPAPRRG